jgi:phenylacetate-CoA ligase
MICQAFANREAIRAHQLRALGHLLSVVAADNPFYAPILRQAGLAGGVADLDEFFRKMPFTYKDAIVEDQRRHPPYGTNLTCPLAEYSRFNQTSASTATPIRWLDTRESWQAMLDNWKQVYRAAGVTAGDCLYFAFSFGPFLGFWTAFEAACQWGCRAIPGGGLSSLARLEAIRDNQADVLLATPTYVLRLAEVARAEKIDPATLAVRTIIVAGEPGGSVPAVRRRIESLWPRATLFDQHGMTEVGPVSYQCPGRSGTLLVMEDSFLAEIVDPRSGRPAVRGEPGELVLTTLRRLGSPLLRYRTGDLVQEDLEAADQEGVCGLALRGGILGRTDDMLLVRGVNVYPTAIDELLRSIPAVAEYQVELDHEDAMTEMRLRVEPSAECGDRDQLVRQIESRFRSRFHLRVPVSLCPPGTLPRFEMKARRFVIRGRP